MRYFLGIEVMQSSAGIFICQKKYAYEVLDRFQMANSNPVQSLIIPGAKLTKDVDGVRIDITYYKQIIGSLMYLSATRPDMAYVVSLFSRFMENLVIFCTTMIFCDNSSTIKLSKNLVLHGCSKHIHIKFHFLRDLTKGVVKLVHCQSQDQIADILTKPLKVEVFVKLRGLLGICSSSMIN